MFDRVVRGSLGVVLTFAFASGAFASAPGSEDYDKATELLAKKSFKDAIPYLDKAIQANPKHSEAFMDRALCNFRLGNYQKVLDDCKEVTTHESAHQITKRQAYMMSTGAHNALGEYNDAVQSADKAISIAPHASISYSDRAFAYKQLKRMDEALHDVNEAIKLDSKHASNYELRASIYESIAKQDRNKYRELMQARKPGENPWEKAQKNAADDKAGKSGDKTADGTDKK